MTPKERIYATIKGTGADRRPVTPIFMSWAGHFVGHTYRDYYLDGNVLVKAQMAVVKAFNLDQISAISDPWREASAYGMEFDYPEEGVGKPRDILLKSPEDISRLKRLNIDSSPRMRQRVESVRKMASEIDATHSVLGWVEGGLAEYADLRGLENAMMDLMDNPQTFLEAGDIIVRNAADFAVRQIEAGADMIGIGDAAASLIGAKLYSEYVLPLEQKLIAAIHRAGGAAKLHICGNTTAILPYMAQTGAEVIDLDWMVDLKKARATIGDDITLCGNFDPSAVLLQGTAEDVAKAAKRCLAEGGKKFFLMPGCEVAAATAEKNIRSFCPCEGCMIKEALAL